MKEEGRGGRTKRNESVKEWIKEAVGGGSEERKQGRNGEKEEEGKKRNERKKNGRKLKKKKKKRSHRCHCCAENIRSKTVPFQ